MALARRRQELDGQPRHPKTGAYSRVSVDDALLSMAKPDFLFPLLYLRISPGR